MAPISSNPLALTLLIALKVSFVNAAAFAHLSKMDNNQVYQCFLSDKTAPNDAPVNMTGIPPDYHEFTNIFSKTCTSTPIPHQPYNPKIELEEGTSPPFGPIYSLSQSELKSLQEFLDEYLAMDFICPSCSPGRALVLFVHKKDGSLCFCVDFCSLNKIMKKDCYPLPHISNLLNSPCKARFYSKINIHHAYHLVHICKGDKWKTAFHTHYGSFEWHIMPFRLMNVPTAFQHFMNDIFGDLLNVCMLVYLDNILIYSDSEEEHIQHVHEVLHHLQQHNLYAHTDKCFFHVQTVEYLGYILSLSGLTMVANKVQVIQDWPEPCKIKDIQSFLGFANFYRCFILHYSDITVPLTVMDLRYQRLMVELLSPMAVMSEGLGFNLCVVPFLNICVPNLPQGVKDRECWSWSELGQRY